ncbi:TetR/AcrR family transcriptional regulator C-terminal domain-containing protein [Bradyrhizobium xenonodulans]|uniref:TetR/AcrR family transcriptional regulator C-terminal domain-containing protein n=1 Tax=Bradyrhizobium xenonodulans TaxID=2736875 RepID=A0ABY7MJJ6_9BRAD|nr:TetR/AcrR family transcriptional regulator C-terminal domain-containing protein [Bradyrhizobium xenonodulans]WBL77517.1 TetR/AcrR family transcriptional regulator C-terminal domain-containing protein [Bradyrhizobium xenonodulans]
MTRKARASRKAAPSQRKRRAAGDTGRGLSRERIAAAAMTLVDRDGLARFSTRRLGEELGCEAMSIYHHFPSKAHLMDALVDLMLAEAQVAMEPQWDWRERLRRAAHGFRAMALKHPAFFPFFAVHRLNTQAGVAYIDGIIGILRDAGFSDREAAIYFRELGYYLTGAALDETAGYASGPSSPEPVSNETIVASFKHLAAAAPFFRSAHFQATFETGLEILLSGIERSRSP